MISPSGAGKNTAASILVERHGFHLQKTVTTRPWRDIHDTDHIFVKDETYQEMAALEQEIKLGRSIATRTFDSSHESADSIAEAIAQLV